MPFAHAINLASQKAMAVQQISRLLAKIRKVVTSFHRSTTAAHVLKTKQELLQLPIHKLIQDIPTRSNSSYDMIERCIEQQTAVYSAMTGKAGKKNVTLWLCLKMTCHHSFETPENWVLSIHVGGPAYENDDPEIHGTVWWWQPGSEGCQNCFQKWPAAETHRTWSSEHRSHCYTDSPTGLRVYDLLTTEIVSTEPQVLFIFRCLLCFWLIICILMFLS